MTTKIDTKLINQSTTQIQSKQPKQIGDFIIGKTLGQGNFGKVRLGIHKYTNQKVAIKILQKKKINQVADVERVTREIHILKLIRHPNLVQLYQIIQTPKQLLLIMQYMENGELFDYIVKKRRIPEVQARKMFHQLLDGIEYMHKVGIAHRDLKPENILLSYDNNKLKIVDFGLGTTYKKGQQLKTPCGSPCYAAPQMIQGHTYEGIKIDIWSSGIILFAMLNGYLPFQDQNTNLLYKKVVAGQYTFHHSVSQQARDLISKILNNNVSQRYTIQQIRNHQWMKKLQHSKHHEGIIVGYNKIPVDQQILKKLSQTCKQKNIEIDYLEKCIEANRYNEATVLYYLTMKKFLKQGGISKYDLGNSQFDKKTIQPVLRKKQNTTEILIDNFFTKNTCSGSTELNSQQERRPRLSKEKQKLKNCQENKQNMSIYMNKKKSKDKVEKKSKDKSKDNIKIVLKQRDHNISTQIMPGSTTNGLKTSSKMIQSIGGTQKRSQSVGKKSGSSTGKIKCGKTSKLDTSINYGRVPMIRSIQKLQKTSARQSQPPQNHYFHEQPSISHHRESIIQNRVARKYKQQFGQSLISKSKAKLQMSTQRQKRSRVNSSSINHSINHNATIIMNNIHTTANCKQNNYSNNFTTAMTTTGIITSSQVHINSKKNKDMNVSSGFIEEYLMRGKKGNKKTVYSAGGVNGLKYNQNDSSKMIKSKNGNIDSNHKGTKHGNQSTSKVVKARRL